MIGVVVEPKFGNAWLNPRGILGSLRTTRKHSFVPGGTNVNLAIIVAACVPLNSRRAHRSARNRVGIRAKDYSGHGRVIS
jgi:hypothetical protein